MSLEDALTTEQGACRIWRGVLSSQGYAVIRVDGEKQYVHRLLCPGSEGMEVHHLCGNRACVNLAHLAVVSRAEHAEAHLRDECRNGHPYTEDNTYITPAGSRQCRECKRTNTRNHLKRRRDAVRS